MPRDYAFSADGSLLYGLRSDGDQQVLFSIDVASGSEKIIGSKPRDYTFGSNLNPSIRFTPSPDGRSFVFGSGQFKTNLWMLEGFTKTKGPFARLLRWPPGEGVRPGSDPFAKGATGRGVSSSPSAALRRGWRCSSHH